MKLKLVSAACLALCSLSSFAATQDSCPSTLTPDALVNKCAPDFTFYMGGASAQAGALTNAILKPANLFDVSAPLVKVRLTAKSISGTGSSTTSLSAGKDGNTIAFVGIGAVGTSAAGKRLAVIYNKANGSFAGVNQLLYPKTGEKENTTLVLTTLAEQKSGKGKTTACTPSAVLADTVTATSEKLGYTTYECDSEVAFNTAWGGDKAKSMSMALADVRPSEATPGIYGGLIAKWKSANFPAVTTGMQGFGVIVSPALYTSLIAAQVAKGQLANSCLTSEQVGGATDTITAACQPNLPTAAYTSLVTGKTTSAADFLGNSDAAGTLITLARRTDTSGTQAASNIFFANQAATAAKATLRDFDNAPTVAIGNPADSAASVSYTDVRVFEKTGTGDVITAVSGATGYALGVVSLENTYSMSSKTTGVKKALYVKLDGISPNLTTAADGTTVLDAKARVGILNGYPMVYEMQALTSAKLGEPYKAIAGKIVTALQDPAGDLAGIAYIGSTDTAKNTPFKRLNSNYAPLSK
jgi:hypothetical protein